MASAEAQARWREKKALAGYCVTCGKRKARPGKSTCKKCSEAAAERVKKARES